MCVCYSLCVFTCIPAVLFCSLGSFNSSVFHCRGERLVKGSKNCSFRWDLVNSGALALVFNSWLRNQWHLPWWWSCLNQSLQLYGYRWDGPFSTFVCGPGWLATEKMIIVLSRQRPWHAHPYVSIDIIALTANNGVRFLYLQLRLLCLKEPKEG